MKKVTYLLILGYLFLFAGCHDITVGYLFTDEAAYPVNKMEIYNIPNKIAELSSVLKQFNEEAAPLKAEYDRLNTILTEKTNELQNYQTTVITPIEDSLKMVSISEDKKMELEKRLAEVSLIAEAMNTEKAVVTQAVWDAQKKIDDKADSMGIASPVLVEKQIAELENRVFYKAPWTTSVIQGVLGTEPLMYDVVGVKNEKAENAEKFRKYITAIGGGRLNVNQNVDVPAGEYIISVRVSNEGREKVLADAFTFIVK